MLPGKERLAWSERRFGFYAVRGFVTAAELRQLKRSIQNMDRLFVETSGLGTVGPKYNVIDGDEIRDSSPELAEYGERRVRPILEEFALQSLKPIESSKRAIRVQLYRRKQHGFRWHFDGHSYVALITLKNTIRGETQVCSLELSSVLRYLPSPFYAVPRLLDFLPYGSIPGEEGDMLLMHGSRVLHRGVSLGERGERLLLIYAYDETQKRLNPVFDKIARRLNY